MGGFGSGGFGSGGFGSGGFEQPSGPTLPIPAGFVAWWRADDINQADGSLVASWIDRSAHGWNLAQPTGAFKPTYRVAGLGGQASLEFPGAQKELDCPYDVLLNPPTTMTLVVVANPTNNGSTGFIVGSRNATTTGNGWLLTKTNGNVMTCMGVTCGGGATGPLWAVVDGDNAAPVVDGYLKGVLGQSSAAAYTVNAGGDPVRLGDDPNFGSDHPYAGQVAEIILYPTKLSAADRAAIDTYVKARYGL